MRVLLVDPSLFIAPYDASLTEGLRANGVETRWATRALRTGEEAHLSEDSIDIRFYRFTEGRQRPGGRIWKYVKGVEHALDLRRLEREASKFDIIHFQFSVLPSLDLGTIRRIRQQRPVILTVHDSTPFNGVEVNPLQSRGLVSVFRAVDHIIVLTPTAKERMVARGIEAERISVIGHGPLTLRKIPVVPGRKSEARWRIVLFGRLQNYKGIDVLVDALARIPPDRRQRLEVIVAGEPLMDVKPIRAQAARLGLSAPLLEFRFQRLTEQDLADLLASADAFVFPYRIIETSGALYLAKGFDKWIIASGIGAFREVLGEEGDRGALVTPGDPIALADALEASIGRTPRPGSAMASLSWESIGATTANVYRDLLERRPDSFRCSTA